MSARPAFPALGRMGERLRIVIVSDAAPPQINGVVRTLGELTRCLNGMGHEVILIGPDRFLTMPAPGYPEIRLALFPGRRLARMIEAANPHAIHIATEGPLGLAARNYCVRRGLPFSTSFHTRFPEYLHARIRFPLAGSYAFLRWFHARASTVMAATPALRDELEARGFGRPVLWSRGVDTELFHPRPELLGAHYLSLPRPVWLYVGRIAVEKNIDVFLETPLPGSRMIVGEGPRLAHLRRRYPDVHFTGALSGEELARAYAAADCFVFPSRTDTFGLVLIEALASGTPVAAYPVQGPLDVIGPSSANGLRPAILDKDLGTACLKAVDLPRAACRDFALGFSWEACTRQFLSNLALESGRPQA